MDNPISVVLYMLVIYGFIMVASLIGNINYSFLYARNISRMVLILRDKYPEQWRSLGSPPISPWLFWFAFLGVWRNRTPWRLLFTDKVREIGDEELIALQKQTILATRYIYVTQWVIGALFIILSFVVIVQLSK